MQLYEYQFVRLEQDKDWLAGERPSKSALNDYQETVQKYAEEGWRLVQIFAPGVGTYGQPRYYELILERPATSRR